MPQIRGSAGGSAGGNAVGIAGPPDRGMVLAAGLGLRMRPITETIPKPLIEVAGRTLLDRVLDHFAAAGIVRAVVNTHYLGGMIAGHLKGRSAPKIELSHEDDLLETGGGVKKALPLLGEGPFFVANSDALWIDGPQNALGRLAALWDDTALDGLLLLHPTVSGVGYDGAGDFFLDPAGMLRRRGEGEIAPFLFAGVQILHPRLFDDAPDGRFSLNVLYDRAIAAGRLHGVRHDGLWYHVGTPSHLAQADAALRP